MLRSLRSSIDPWVFWIAVVLILSFVVWGLVATESLSAVALGALAFITGNFGWVFILGTFGFLAFVLYLAFSRYGKVRLGGDDERPEFRTTSWIAMMFSAGMGIGLMFYGVAEPITHFTDPPFNLAPPETREAAELAMQYTIFHWALHPWGIYALFGMALAYFTFRRGRGNLVSEIFRPLIGDRVDGSTGKAIDILAIFATLFGSATSLGLGALQISEGLNIVSGGAIPSTVTVAVIIIAVITVLFIISAVTGVHRGIEWLSNTNMVLAIILVLFLFIVGPAIFILSSFTGTIGSYIQNFFSMSFRTSAFTGEAGDEFLSSWTLYYWAWWISWAPFVGTFIARISRGRTIREFVLGVLLVPSVISLAWFAIVGGSALNLALTGQAGIVEAVSESQAAALFATLQAFPLTTVMSVLAITLVALFFISGADAASVVMGMLSSRGNIEPKASVIIVWGSLTGASTAVLLLIAGESALSGLQAGALISAAPFVIIMVCMIFALFKALRSERQPEVAPEPGRAVTTSPGHTPPEPARSAAHEPDERRA